MSAGQRKTGAAAVAVVAVFAFGFLALKPIAAAPTATEIQHVATDLTADTVTVTGTGFDQKSDTCVTLGGSLLAIVSETTTEIVAQLPAAMGAYSHQWVVPPLSPGTYDLEISYAATRERPETL